MNDNQYIVYWNLSEGEEPLYALRRDGQCVLLDSLPESAISCVVVLPSVAVSNQLLTVSVKQLKSMHRAFPYILEDELLESVDLMHHVYALKAKQGEEAVLQSISISAELMESVLGFFQRQNVRVNAIYVDADLIECPEEGQVNILPTPGGVNARLPDGSFVAVELLETSEWSGLLRRDILSSINDDSFLSYLSDRLALEHDAQNLLQGDYAQKDSGKNWKAPLKAGSALFVLAFVVQFIYWQASAYVFGERAGAQLENARNEYRRIFPGDARIIDIRKQASGHLKRAAQPGGNIVLLDLVSVLSEVSEDEGLTLVLQSIRYDQASGETTVVMHLDSVSRAEKLMQALTGKGISSSLGQVRKEGDGVIARLRIKS
ncbi:type II secretion system protein GspL [Pseudoteredinibacter isoporae]|uniref:Type II secretion system protein L n=1 Tax=Pseudoteredinibacter isoporae TaxID=570281 RepID=A0A7X0JU42_9GAMM|nr:type II secretion system protein GspL [Pseudoteredinibacter isoporae]MBB6521864.1 general secretion pathway protein L [Pseudoteredinibacter isoporae]NHO87408.1 hypothetical protein [Pseudoteredinibacter isoporae]NIB24261.1 hypothetical protein [Pseudoteredinibacter isoporae]